MVLHADIEKSNNESTANLIRRFTKRMQSAGVVKKVKATRYMDRKPSDFVRKKNALRRIAKTARIERLKKLGKI